MTLLRRLRRDNSGAAALEFAFIGLPFVLLLLSLLEFGRGLYIKNAVAAAADRGQRAVLLDPSASATAVDAEIRDGFLLVQPEKLAIAHGTFSAAGVDYRVIQLSYDMQLLLPTPIGRTISIATNRRVTTQ